MSFTSTSKYVQITPYLLMEYMYAAPPDAEKHFVNSGSSVVGYDKLVNGFRGGAIQILNPDSAYDITKNTLKNSVVRIAENSFVTLNSNLIIPFNDYSDNLTHTNDLPIVFPSNLSVVYDSIRYHIRAGYNLGNIDGIIMSVEFQDQNLDYVTVSQILIKKGTEQDYTLNPNPVTIGADIYDKYFEIKIPNIKDMNNKYLIESTYFQPETLAALISASGKGFVQNAPIRITCWQIQNIVEFDGYLRYNSAKIATLSLEQEDAFSNIGATIQESTKGEFFEFFATDNMGFIEDFILFQNSQGGAYYISHQIDVLEQIGAALIQTSGFQSIQTTAYDTPNYYRPIVRNAGIAVSFTLRYTMTLINSADQSRVTRIASYTSTNPAKWGTHITPIQLSVFPQTQKVYNRIFSQPQIMLGSSDKPTPKEIIKYSNVFIEQDYVTATATNLSFSNNSLSSHNGSTDLTAYGTGKLNITVSPFDNYYKFKFIKSSPSGDPVPIDLSSSGNFTISFIDQTGKKLQVPSLADSTIANPASGELAFKVDESTATKILQLTDRRFFIVNGVSVNQVTTSVTDKSTVTVNAGVTTNTVDKTIEAVISNRRIATSQANTTSGTTVATSTLLTAVNNSSSVMYWGYWKMSGENDIVSSSPTPAGATGSTGATSGNAIIPSQSSGTGTIGNIPLPSPIVQSITPAYVGSGSTGGIGSPTTANVNQTLTGSILIASLSAEMSGYKSIGWADQTIINYFLTPGKPGRIKYPNITASDVAKAGKGILAPASVKKLENQTR
jgi:hypothetical protein